DERAWIGNSVRRAALSHGRVEESVLPDDDRALVRQERERDAAPRREIGQHRDRIVADCDEAETFAAQLGQSSLQLDELRLTVRLMRPAGIVSSITSSAPASHDWSRSTGGASGRRCEGN